MFGRTGGKDGKKNTSYLNRLKANSDSLAVYNKALKNQRELNSIIDYNTKTKEENKKSKAAYDKETSDIAKAGIAKPDRRPSVIMNTAGDTLTREEYNKYARKQNREGRKIDSDTTNVAVDRFGPNQTGVGPFGEKYGKFRQPYKPKKLKLFNKSMRSGDVEKLKPGPPPKKEEVVKVRKKLPVKKLPVKKTKVELTKVPKYLVNKGKYTKKKKNIIKNFITTINPFNGKKVVRKRIPRKKKVLNLVTGKKRRL